MSATHTASYEIGSLHAFAVSERHLKFFDKETQKRTQPRHDPWQ